MARNTQVATDHDAPPIPQLLARSMTGAQLEAKFTELSAPVIGADKTKALIAAAWNIGGAADVRAITATARA